MQVQKTDDTTTPVPTSTVDYMQTAIIAQQTADEARRVNTIVTAEHEQLLMGQLLLTADAEQREQAISEWTAIVANTSIPLTATQQVYVNTQISERNRMVAAEMTRTAVYPTQIVAAVRAENYKKFGGVLEIVQITGLGGLVVFMVSLSVFVLRHPLQKMEEGKPDEELVMWMKQSHSHGSSDKKITIPCSEDQLTEFAVEILGKRRTLAINQWEGNGTLFKRDTYLQFRAWLRDPFGEAPKPSSLPFAISGENDQLVATEALMDFLRGWMEGRRLPEGLVIERPSPSPTEERA
jgi:hypothetical protein